MTLVAACIAALVAVLGYVMTQTWARRERRAKAFAEALAAVEDYMESPYRIRRRASSASDHRSQLTTAISDVQSRITFHQAWLHVEAPRVATAYDALVRAARDEAGTHMREAWAARPLRSDAEMNLVASYPRVATDAAREEVVMAARRDLRLLRLWTR